MGISYAHSMLDWYTGIIETDTPIDIPAGVLISVNSDGEEEWVSPKMHPVKSEHEQPSYSTTVMLKAVSPTEKMQAYATRHGRRLPPTMLWLSGNPNKFLHGHNVDGEPVWRHKELLGLMLERKEFAELNLRLAPKPLSQVGRFDIAGMFKVGCTCQEVHHILLSLAAVTRSRQQNALCQGTTVYWNRGSSLWQLKMYCKLCEMLRHPMNWDKRNSVEGYIRIELTLKRKEQANLHARYGSLDLLRSDLETILEFVGRLTMSDNRIATTTPAGLKGTYLASYLQWKEGVDLTLVLPRNTFYRHRNHIIKITGHDISVPCPLSSTHEDGPNLIDMFRPESLRNCYQERIPRQVAIEEEA